MKRFFLVFTLVMMVGASNVYASVNRWYLKDTVKYENVKVTNVFYAPYLHSPRICAFFTASQGGSNVAGCAVADNDYYQKNTAQTSPFMEIFDTVKYFYTTGEKISVYIKLNAFPEFDTTVSKHEIVAIGTCNGWCFGETIK
ncbi:pertussis toxin [Salmonella enterica]|nr:pertussis toxin [Salmonella enterica]EHJ0980224.1 pertussis toxin [Salmonella enterica]ELH6756834.1 pertussis toxin [Salmonella enterica subsp. enterica serovar Rubislaw]HDN4684920.1 pertussis toxin [Salmonella enterica subsp. enterica serovar Ball]